MNSLKLNDLSFGLCRDLQGWFHTATCALVHRTVGNNRSGKLGLGTFHTDFCPLPCGVLAVIGEERRKGAAYAPLAIPCLDWILSPILGTPFALARTKSSNQHNAALHGSMSSRRPAHNIQSR